jgi:thiamine-monophosphate kinase
LGELGLIQRIQARFKTRNGGVRVGIGDDCAVLGAAAGRETVVTTDLFLEGRHFRRDWHTAESAGHRCLARGLSDLAAMGADPHAVFLSLSLPRECEVAWVDGFLRGFGALAERFGVELAGGDTSESPAGWGIFADVVAVGSVPEGMALLRSGARVGDGIFVTGTLGGAAAELSRLQSGAAGQERLPEPRVRVGSSLRTVGMARAGMDLSDGLSSDLRKLCEASGVGAEIWEEALPVAEGASVEQALHGGEDYELLFTAWEGAIVEREIRGVKVTKVGRVVAETEGVRIVREGGVLEELGAGGWEHFGQPHS